MIRQIQARIAVDFQQKKARIANAVQVTICLLVSTSVSEVAEIKIDSLT